MDDYSISYWCWVTSGCDILGVCEEIVIAGIILGMLAWGFLVDGLKDAFALKRRNWIDRQAIYELYQEEVEQRKRELKVIKEINELYEEPRNKQ